MSFHEIIPSFVIVLFASTSIKKQELRTLHELLGSLPFLDGVHVAHLFIFLRAFFFVLCLCPKLQVSLDCPFLIVI